MSCGTLQMHELRRRGYRMTPQRQNILHILIESGGHFSPSEIFRRAMHSSPGITEATIYRTLDFLAENGMIHPAVVPGGHLEYEIFKENHHHLVCQECGTETPAENEVVKKAILLIEKQSGFRLNKEHLTFAGVCPECSGKETRG